MSTAPEPIEPKVDALRKRVEGVVQQWKSIKQAGAVAGAILAALGLGGTFWIGSLQSRLAGYDKQVNDFKKQIADAADQGKKEVNDTLTSALTQLDGKLSQARSKYRSFERVSSEQILSNAIGLLATMAMVTTHNGFMSHWKEWVFPKPRMFG
jgi:uncharacterized protein HemX